MHTIEKSKTWDKEPPEMVKKVGDALKKQCLKEFGSCWDYDTTWNFARAAIEAMREPDGGLSLVEKHLDECFKGFNDTKKACYFINDEEEVLANRAGLKNGLLTYQAMINKALEE